MASTPTSSFSSSGLVRLPQPLRTFFALFPLYTHDAISPPSAAHPITRPTLWVHPPRPTISDTVEASEAQHLSADVECLKWQAFLALRGVRDLAVRFDVSPDGAIEGRLPNLHVPLASAVDSANVKQEDDGAGDLLAAHLIPEWVARQVGEVGELEGYRSVETRDESRAWVSLLEGNVHAALLFFQPAESTWRTRLSAYPTTPRSLESILNPPPAPLTGISSLFPPYGVHIDRSALELKYKEAIASLSVRLGTDRWFLGSDGPTALDALLFAYLHVLLHPRPASPDGAHILRFEVTRRVNLVAWERRVRSDVQAAFASKSAAA